MLAAICWRETESKIGLAGGVLRWQTSSLAVVERIIISVLAIVLDGVKLVAVVTAVAKSSDLRVIVAFAREIITPER